jgi:predicted permease
MRGFPQDLRFALRRLRQSPAFTTIAVLTLALGIGATTAIFSVLDAVVLRPLPFTRSSELQMVWETMPGNDTRWVAPANFVDWRRSARSFTELAAFSPSAATLTGGDAPERLSTVAVSANFFDVLGARASLGRALMPSDAAPDAGAIVVLSDDLWRRRYGSDAGIVGRDIAIDGQLHRVVGVMPRGFRFPETADLWVAAPRDVPGLPGFPGDITMSRDVHYLSVIGRLRPGLGADAADAEMTAIAARLAERYPADNAGLGANVVSLHTALVGDVEPTLLLLFAAVGLVLLIACANVAGLLLARAEERSREAAICVALGATRGRMLSRTLAESLALGVAGGIVGTFLATWGIDALLALAPGDLPRTGEIGLDGRVIAFTLAVSLVCGACFGLFPAIRAWRLDLHSLLKAGGRLTVGTPKRRLRGLLVVTELALALTLLTGAGLLLQSVVGLLAVNPGFRAENVLSARLSLPQAKYETPDRAGAMFGMLLERARALPGVVDASAVSELPASGSSMNRGFVIDGRPAPARPADQTVEYRVADPRYFATMGVPVLSGRTFTAADAPWAPRVAAISERMARQYWPDGSPIGARVALGDPANAESWRPIVGVVGNVAHFGLASAPFPEIYVPAAQSPERAMYIVVRASAPATAVNTALREIVASLDPDQPLTDVQTMTQRLTGSVARQRFVTTLLGSFAGVAVFLSIVGVYALMATMVQARTREIGLRMALGARAGDLVRMLVARGLRLVALGVALGVVASFAATRALGSLLFGVGASDPTTFVGVSMLLAGVALVAIWIPARRAARVDPMITLTE